MYEPEALNKILEQFCATVQVRIEGGVRLRTWSIRVIITAIDRYLIEKEYKYITQSRIRKFLREKPGYSDDKAKAGGRTRQEVWQQPRKISCGIKEAGKGKSAISLPNIFVAPDPVIWPLRSSGKPQSKISPLDWMKTKRRTSNSSRTCPDYPQGPEASFQKCLQLDARRCPVTIFKESFLSIQPATLSVLCANCLVQTTADGSEHDEFRNQRNDPGPWANNYY